MLLVYCEYFFIQLNAKKAREIKQSLMVQVEIWAGMARLP